MYNLQLDTFLKVADSGSFTKAAEILYISPTAIIKQINILEDRTGIKLFIRTHRGLKLTEAGKSFYKDSKQIIKFSKIAIEKAQNIQKEIQNTIRVGTSPMTPETSIIELWTNLKIKEENLKLQLISFENTPENAKEILGNFGEKIDIVAGIYDNKMLKKAGCSAFYLETIKLSCAIPLNHRLINKDILNIEDFYGENIMLLNRGNFLVMDNLRDEIEKNHSQINIVDFDFFNLDVFNQAENTNSILIGMNKQFVIHPLLKNVEVNWNFKTPYGILHSPNPSKNVENFLNAITKIIKK